MKTIIFLLLSIITSTCLLGQNVFSFQPTNKESGVLKASTVLDNNEINEQRNSLDTKINFFKSKISDIRAQIITLQNIKVFKENLNFDSLKIINNVDSVRENLELMGEELSDLNNNIDLLTNKLNEIKKKQNGVSVGKDTSDFQFICRKGVNSTARGDFWNELGKPQNGILLNTSFKDLGGTLFSEILIDYLGPFRFSFSAAVTAASQDSAKTNSEKNTVQNFFAAGGNAIIRSILPILFFSNRTDVSKPGNNSRYISLYLSNRLSIGMPSLGNSLQDPSGFFDASLESQFRILTNEKVFGIEGYLGIGTFSATKDLKDALTTKDDPEFFKFYCHGAFKFIINNKYGIQINFPVSFKRKYAIDEAPVSISVNMII